MTATAFALVAGLVIGLRNTRRRLKEKYGLRRANHLDPLYMRHPWRQTVASLLIAGIILGGIPQEAFADTTVVELPNLLYYHGDHLGSSSVITNGDYGSEGDKVKLYVYTPFGDEAHVEDYHGEQDYAYENISHRYTGQIFDAETGLYYYNARYYDPELARFIQADSVLPDQSSQSLNRYSYCVNNPLIYTDPSGNDFGITAIIIGMAVGAALGGASAAVNGGNVWAGIGYGALGGSLGGLGAWGGFAVANAAGWGTIGTAAAVGVGAAAGGALSGAISGGDPGMSAIISGITAGIGCGLGLGSAEFLSGDWFGELAVSAGISAVVGGTVAEIKGGDFWRAAGDSAMWASAGFVLTTSVEEVLYVPEKDSSGVALTGSEPDYNPNLWNDPDYIDYNNCYAYAVNDPKPIPERTAKPQPGTMAGSRITAVTVDAVKVGAKADGLIYLGNSPNSTIKIPKDHYVVALVVDPGKDYHWYRHNPNGTWSHKPGGTRAVNVDASRAPITNPQIANRNYGRLNYTDWGGYFAVPKSGIKVR